VTPATERVLAWIAALFGEDVMARVFHPLVADWQHEMRHAHCGVPRLRSAIAGTLALGSAALLTAVSMATPWRAAPAMRWSTRRTLAGFGTVGTLILLAPFLKYQDGSLRLALWLVALMPSSLPVALSFALLPAAMACAAVEPASARVRSRFFVVGVTAITIVYVTLSVAWLGPLANQIWREAIAGASLDRGIHELAVSELWTADTRRYGQHALEVEWRTRLSLAIAWPAALALFGWRVGRHRGQVTVCAMAGWWIVAASLVAAMDPLRLWGKDVPWLLLPCVWLLIAMFVRPRRGSDLAASR